VRRAACPFCDPPGLPAEALTLLSEQDIPVLRNSLRAGTPSLKSIKDYLAHVAAAKVDKQGGISLHLWHLSERFDTPEHVLHRMAASLELDGDKGYLRYEATRCFSFNYHLGPRFWAVDKSDPNELVLSLTQQTKEKRTFVRLRARAQADCPSSRSKRSRAVSRCLPPSSSRRSTPGRSAASSPRRVAALNSR